MVAQNSRRWDKGKVLAILDWMKKDYTRLITGIVLAGLLPVTIFGAQQASAITIVADSSLPGEPSNWCTTSITYTTVLDVSIANTSPKFISATLLGWVSSVGANDYGTLNVQLVSGGTQFDFAYISWDQIFSTSDQQDTNLALTYSTTSSSTKEVKARTVDSGDQVCLHADAGDLRVVY
jgi:hypothetical protein